MNANPARNTKKRKVPWYGHVSRQHSMSGEFFQGTIEGKRRRGGCRKMWLDNIKDDMPVYVLPPRLNSGQDLMQKSGRRKHMFQFFHSNDLLGQGELMMMTIMMMMTEG